MFSIFQHQLGESTGCNDNGSILSTKHAIIASSHCGRGTHIITSRGPPEDCPIVIWTCRYRTALCPAGDGDAHDDNNSPDVLAGRQLTPLILMPDGDGIDHQQSSQQQVPQAQPQPLPVLTRYQLSEQVDLVDAYNQKQIDLSRSGQSLWLVKVPKYLDELWRKARDKQEVGYLVTSEGGGGDSGGSGKGVSLRPSEAALAMADRPDLIPRDHSFIIDPSGGGRNQQTLLVLQEEFSRRPGQSPEAQLESSVSIYGTVRRRVECRPQNSAVYMSLKKHQIERNRSAHYRSEQLDKQVQPRKPMVSHAGIDQMKRMRKDEGKKLRDSREAVQTRLFTAFEKHQYYNIRDLVDLTKQPLPFLKEVLKEIAVHNNQGPHKNMWELKPEYRHYKRQQSGGGAGPSSSSGDAADGADDMQVV